MLEQNIVSGLSRSINITFSTKISKVARLGMVMFFGLMLASPAVGDARKFTYVYEVTTMPAGAAEYEQWVTWKTDKKDDSSFDRFDFRHELEFGITDDFQLAIYVADWRYEDGQSVDKDRARYKNSAVEMIYNLSDPVVDPLGLALYGEVKLGDEKFVLEGKVLVQKDLGAWTVGYNATFEAEWEGESYEEDKAEVEQSLGVSYQVDPTLSLGVELLHEVEFDDWEETGHNIVYFGPNVAYRADGWWGTLTQLFQISDQDSEADFQTRLIFAFDF